MVAPRFLGTAGETADADRVAVPVADTDPAIPCRVAVRLDDPTTGPTTSPSHALGTEPDGSAVLLGTLDRDVVVRWPVAAPQPALRLEAVRSGDEAFGLLNRHVFCRMDRDIDRPFQHRLFNLAGEQALAANLFQRAILDRVAGDFDDLDREGVFRQVKGGHQPASRFVGLREGQW